MSQNKGEKTTTLVTPKQTLFYDTLEGTGIKEASQAANLGSNIQGRGDVQKEITP